MKSAKTNFFTLSLALSGSILSSALAHADDTEVFFGGPAIDDATKPNVLFILDNSGSMNWRLDNNNNANGVNSRLMVLKEAFQDIVYNSSGINVGVMALNPRAEYGNTRMIYPVTYIDKELPTDATQVAGTPSILTSADDAVQDLTGPNAGSANLNTSSLGMGQISVSTNVSQSSNITLTGAGAFYLKSNTTCRLTPTTDPSGACQTTTLKDITIDGNGAQPNNALFHFSGFNIPSGATINDAYITFSETNNKKHKAPFSFTFENSATPSLPNHGTPLDSAKVFLPSTTISSNINWNNSPATFTVTSSIQTIVNSNIGSAINSVLVSVQPTNNTDYKFCANPNSCGGNSPRLVIQYTSALTSTEQRMTALRFQNVGIPQGAVITSAVLGFAPAATSAVADNPSFSIKAQAASDSAAFTAGENLNSRSKTVATTTWTPPSWTVQNPSVVEPGPDVTNVVQEVVNRSDWCGNNAMAFFVTPLTVGYRAAWSIDGAQGLQPTLTINYTGGSGCNNPIVETRVGAEKNDGDQNLNSNANLGNSVLNTRYAGARFEKLPIRRNATIMEASITVTPSSSITSGATFTPFIQNIGSAPELSAAYNNLSARANINGGTCTITSSTGNWPADKPYTCSSTALKNALQALVNRGDWVPSNNVAIILDKGNSTIPIKAFESNPAESIKLRIKVANGGLDSSTNTVRYQVNSLVQSMYAGNGTPVVPAMYDAAQYLRGNSSPITSACQSTHTVLLTDGVANSNTTAAKNGIGSLIGSSCTGDSGNDGERCARSLSEWWATQDQTPTISGDNFVTTHTVGFALDASDAATSASIKDFLQDLATEGGGTFNTASNASDLTQVFNNIIQEVLATDTTFVSPGATVNQFERTENKNEVYFALFKPSDTDRWVGNLKRFSIDDGTGDLSKLILDRDGIAAVDPLTGGFKATSRSFWSTSADGNNTANGGAASQIPTAASRNLRTYIGNAPSSPVTLNTAATELSNNNTSILNGHLNATDDAERVSLINWIRGQNDDSSQRKAMGDPLHSVPQLVTYGCTAWSGETCTSEDQSVYVGTNEGFIQAFNTNTGVEQFAFMPQALLSNIKKLKTNAKTASPNPKPYGMDNSVLIWKNDLNGNGLIYGDIGTSSTSLNTGEFVYLYATMRRGGRDIYALDITNRSSPRLLWQIQGGVTPGFEYLGQTWSVPVRGKIKVGSVDKNVLIFGGGYNPAQDNVDVRTADTYGNALYIVDAETGSLIWSASSFSGHTKTFTKMKYSMPASPRIYDIDGDGLTDQILIGDVGGQIWRFFINKGESGSSLVTGIDSNGNSSADNADGVMADVVPSNYSSLTLEQRQANTRRFYNTPDAVLLQTASGTSLVVNIGSGYRAHPLSTRTTDRFYSFRSSITYNPANGAPGTNTALTESALYDATDNLVQSGSSAAQEEAAEAFAERNGGWFITLTGTGEKNLTRALTIEGVITFTTYEPTANTADCRASAGINWRYEVNLYDATPLPGNIDSTSGNATRKTKLNSGGISGDTTVLIRDNSSGGSSGVKCNGIECEEFDFKSGTGKIFWIDEL